MKKEKMNMFITEFLKAANRIHQLEMIPIDIGEGELLYPSEIHTINAIGKNCDTVTEISLSFGITKGAVSQIIYKLSEKGYIVKTKNESNRKEINLSLTDKGRRAYEVHMRLHDSIDKDINNIMQNYSDESINVFIDLISNISKKVDGYIQLKK